MRKATSVVGLLLLTLGVVAVACGDSEEKGTNKATSTSGQGQVVDVEADDYYFDPKDLSGDVGKAVTVKLGNDGKVAHTFTIDELGVDQTVQPDQEVTVTFMPAKGGTFAFYCKFHRASNGMEGTLKVSGSSAGGSAPSPAAGGGTTASPSSGGYYGGGY